MHRPPKERSTWDGHFKKQHIKIPEDVTVQGTLPIKNYWQHGHVHWWNHLPGPFWGFMFDFMKLNCFTCQELFHFVWRPINVVSWLVWWVGLVTSDPKIIQDHGKYLGGSVLWKVFFVESLLFFNFWIVLFVYLLFNLFHFFCCLFLSLLSFKKKCFQFLFNIFQLFFLSNIDPK